MKDRVERKALETMLHQMASPMSESAKSRLRVALERAISASCEYHVEVNFNLFSDCVAEYFCHDTLRNSFFPRDVMNAVADTLRSSRGD